MAARARTLPSVISLALMARVLRGGADLAIDPPPTPSTRRPSEIVTRFGQPA
jgi:hypothetical protein